MHAVTRAHLAVQPATSPFPEPRAVGPDVEVVIPAHNEQFDLERNVLRLYGYLRASLPYTFRITIADNASDDATWDIATRLAVQVPEVRAIHLDEKGRGKALHSAWSGSDATVLAYMDVDLSTDLAAVLPLLAPLLSGHSDVAIGTRLSSASRVVRGPRRELLSRGYNLVVRTTLGTEFTDAQCGFKAIRSDAARELLPLVEDREWFFDTELLVLAERAGMRIHEVPVDWIDDPSSTVDIGDTVYKDLTGIWRLGRGLRTGRIPVAALRRPELAEHAAAAPPGMVRQAARFGLVGVLSTLAFGVLFWAFRAGLSAQAANALALLLTALGNTAANRWFTFEVRGRAGRMRHQARGLVVFGFGLAVTGGALTLLGAFLPEAPPVVELAVLTIANVGATLLRFALFRGWVFRVRQDHPAIL